MTIPIGEITGADRLDIGKNAKCALERVCSGAGLDPPSRYYSPKFVDHVNNFPARSGFWARTIRVISTWEIRAN